MKALVTGSSGFIGSHLFASLLNDKRFHHVVGVSRKYQYYPHEFAEQNHRTMKVNCDLAETGRVADLMLRYKPDIVFHMAGNPLIKPNIDDPVAITRDNVLSTHNLLAYCQPGTRFVLASSCAVYGDGGTDTWCQEEAAINPTSVYGATKAAAEALVTAHTNLGMVRGLSLRYAATIGPRMTHGLVLDLVRKILDADGNELCLLGDRPGSYKPFTHIEDVVRGTIDLALSDNNGVFNLCNFDILPVEDVTNLAMRTLDIVLPVRWLGKASNWKGDNPVVRVDNRKAALAGWQPRLGSAYAVIRTVEQIKHEW